MNQAIGVLVAILVAVPPSAPVAGPRFEAEWADGSRTIGESLAEWRGTSDGLRLDGRLLLDPARPIRTLVDRTLSPPPKDQPESFIEFRCGDRLPGRVVGYRVASDLPARPAALLIAATEALDLPGMPPRGEISVRADAVRRLVRKPRAAMDRALPGTLVQSDGQVLTFRALRWDHDSVRLLLDDRPESVRVAFAEIAELCVPSRDPGDFYLRSLAALVPSCGSWLLRVETIGGLTATTSLERARARTLGDGVDPANWYFLLHPAWSLDALFLPHGQIRRRIYFTPYEVPLDAIEPARGEPTMSRSGLAECGWGLRIRGGQDVEFALPPCARTFRARLVSGSARGLIFNGTVESKHQFSSPPGIVPGTVLDTGRLTLDDRARLILRTEAGDGVSLDWREPLLVLDPIRLRLELNARASGAVTGLDGWTTSEPPGEAWQVVNRADLDDRASPGFRPVLALRRSRLTLARAFRIDEGRGTLIIRAGRVAEEMPACQAEIRVDGRRVGTVALDSSQPVVVDLRAFVGREPRVEVTFIPRGDEVLIEWEGAALAARPPEGGSIP